MCNSASWWPLYQSIGRAWAKFDSEGFAKFDLVEDDIYPADFSPNGEQKLRDLALARSKKQRSPCSETENEEADCHTNSRRNAHDTK